MAFDPTRYPANWLAEIRPRILDRDGHCCKFCGLADRQRGWWGRSGQFYTVTDWAEAFIPADDETAVARKMERRPAGSLVVLTVAHLDHGLTDHRDENLAALCQRCHLNHDRAATAAKRAQGIRYGRRKRQLPLEL